MLSPGEAGGRSAAVKRAAALVESALLRCAAPCAAAGARHAVGRGWGVRSSIPDWSAMLQAVARARRGSIQAGKSDLE